MSFIDYKTYLAAQLRVEEGDRLVIYDDATGKPFLKGDTLKGNLSVGFGINLMGPWDPAELSFIESNRIDKGMKLLAQYPWFSIQDPIRQIALGDIAYNIGVAGLLHWPHFLSYMAKKDYPAAVAELKTDALWIYQVHAARAGRLETMIETGAWPPDIPVSGVPA